MILCPQRQSVGPYKYSTSANFRVAFFPLFSTIHIHSDCHTESTRLTSYTSTPTSTKHYQNKTPITSFKMTGGKSGGKASGSKNAQRLDFSSGGPAHPFEAFDASKSHHTFTSKSFWIHIFTHFTSLDYIANLYPLQPVIQGRSCIPSRSCSSSSPKRQLCSTCRCR